MFNVLAGSLTKGKMRYCAAAVVAPTDRPCGVTVLPVREYAKTGPAPMRWPMNRCMFGSAPSTNQNVRAGESNATAPA